MVACMASDNATFLVLGLGNILLTDEQAGVRVAEAVGKLASEPRPAGCRKLKGHADIWRLRVGSYRIIYSITDTIKLVRVERVRHRKDAYR